MKVKCPQCKRETTVRTNSDSIPIWRLIDAPRNPASFFVDEPGCEHVQLSGGNLDAIDEWEDIFSK